MIETQFKLLIMFKINFQLFSEIAKAVSALVLISKHALTKFSHSLKAKCNDAWKTPGIISVVKLMLYALPSIIEGNDELHPLLKSFLRVALFVIKEIIIFLD